MWGVSTQFLGQTAKSFASNILFEDKDGDDESEDAAEVNDELQNEPPNAHSHAVEAGAAQQQPDIYATPSKQERTAMNQGPVSVKSQPGGLSLGIGGMFSNTASSVMRSVGSVANHVVGGDDAGAAARVKSHLDNMKEQLIAGARENDALSSQVHKLEQELRRMREDSDMMRAGADTTPLLRQELQQEQQAHVLAKQQLQQVSNEIETSMTARDNFWKHEIEQEQVVASSLKAQLQQLESQLASQGLHAAASPNSVAADPLAAQRIAQLEGLLHTEQGQVVSLSGQLESSAKLVAKLESQVASLSDDLAAGAGRTAELEAQLAAQEQQMALLSAELGGVQGEAASQAAALGHDHARDLEALSLKVHSMEVELLRARAEAAAAAEAAAVSTQGEEQQVLLLQLQSTEAELSEQRVLYENVNAQAQALTAELEAFKGSGAAAAGGGGGSDGGTLAAMIEALQQELAEERAAAESLQEELDSMQALDESGVREQLSMMKELYDEERQFSLKCKASMEAEAALHAQLKITMGEEQRLNAGNQEGGASSAATAQLQLEQTFAELSRKASTLEDTLAQLQVAESRLAAAQVVADGSAAQLAAAAATITGLQQQLARQEAEVSQLRQAVEEANSEMEAEQQSHEDTQTMMEQKLHALKGKNDQLAHEEQDEKAQIAQLEEALHAGQAQIEQLEVTLQAEHAARQVAEESTLGLQVAGGDTEDEVERLREHVDALKEGNMELMALLDIKTQNAVEMQQRMQALQLELADAQTHSVADGEAGLAAVVSANQALQLRVMEAESRLVLAAEEVVQLTQHLEISNSALAEANTHCDNLVERQAADLEQMDARHRTELEQAGARHAALLQERSSELDAANAHYKAILQQHGSGLAGETAALTQRLEASSAELAEAQSRCQMLVSEHDAQLKSLSAQYDEVVTALYDERRQHEVEMQERGRREAASLAEASEQIAELQHEVDALQRQMAEVGARSMAGLMERDEFWKKELSSKSMSQSELEHRYRQTLDQLGREQASFNTILTESDRLKQELSSSRADMAAQAEFLAAQRNELEATQVALERAHSQAASYEHEHELDRELADVKKECARLSADNRRLTAAAEQVQRGTSDMAAVQQSLHKHALELEVARAALQASELERTSLLHKLREVEQQRQQQLQFGSTAVAMASELHLPAGAQHPPLVSTTYEGGPVPSTALHHPELEARIAELEEGMQAGEAERERLRSQLQRLKQQMMSEQEDDEEKIGWRVEAELKHAADAHAHEMRAIAASHEAAQAALVAEVERLSAEISRVSASTARMQSESEGWEEILVDKEREVANLQAALGELTYESEAAEKLRMEIRATAARLHAVQQELVQCHGAVTSERSAREAAEAASKEASKMVELRRQDQMRTSEECSMLRKALDQAMAQAQAMRGENNSMVDRRIIVKLLVTYFEKGSSKEVLSLMARMLNMTEEEKGKVGLLGGGRRGFLRSAAFVPLSIVQGLTTRPAAPAVQDGSASLADQWVNFLLSQSELDNNQTYALAAATHDVSHSGSFRTAATPSRERAAVGSAIADSRAYPGSADPSPATGATSSSFNVLGEDRARLGANESSASYNYQKGADPSGSSAPRFSASAFPSMPPTPPPLTQSQFDPYSNMSRQPYAPSTTHVAPYPPPNQPQQISSAGGSSSEMALAAAYAHQHPAPSFMTGAGSGGGGLTSPSAPGPPQGHIQRDDTMRQSASSTLGGPAPGPGVMYTP